tara:strand:- start:244 stop:573 length:330 start_codon:yes stop_codon:yes gene_type:complete
MNPKSVKAKGRALQNLVRDRLHQLFPKLKEDIHSQTMGMKGMDIVLTPKAKKSIPYAFECKNVEKFNLWKTWEQAMDNAEKLDPVVVVKKNREKPKVVIDLELFLKLIK